MPFVDHFGNSLLKDKVALVTGAGRGPGRSFALRLGREGARVAANDLNPENAESVAAEICSAGGEAAAWVADVSSKHAIQNMIDEVLERWERIDILVNAAVVRPRATVIRMDEWDWDRALDVNLKGPFLMCQSAGRIMKASGGGVIVNVLSLAGSPDRAAYLASQFGLIGFTRACAQEFAAHGIRVNAACQSGPDDWLDSRRAGSLDDLVVFLCSAELTGQAIGIF